MARVGAFRGGPLRVGWVPLALGGVVIVGGGAYLLLRRRQAANYGGQAAPTGAYGGASQPAARNVFGPTIPIQPAGDGAAPVGPFPVAPGDLPPGGGGPPPPPAATPPPTPSGTNPLPSGSPPPPASNPSAQQLYQVHPQAWSFAPNQTAEPIFAQPSWQSSPISFIPLGTRFRPTGPSVPGLSALTDLGTSSYYLPYQGGYVSAAAATQVPAA